MFSLERDYILGALVVLAIVMIVLLLRKRGPHAEPFTVIEPPPGGWPAIRATAGAVCTDCDLSGGTIPAWGDEASCM